MSTTRRAYVLYASLSAGLILVAGGVLSRVYAGPAEQRAVWVSAALAFVIQLLAFAVARLLAKSNNGVAGWTLGALICLATLVIYGFIARATGVPTNAALLSLAIFLFLTELIEPPLLTP